MPLSKTERGIAFRRHHEQRKQEKARFVVRRQMGHYDPLTASLENWIHKRAAKRRNHLACCSCSMCGNPRRHFDEPTMQERRFAESLRDQCSEVGLDSCRVKNMN